MAPYGIDSPQEGAAVGLLSGVKTAAEIGQGQQALDIAKQKENFSVYLQGIKAVMEDPATAPEIEKQFASRGLKLDPGIVTAGKDGIDALGHLTNFILNDGDVPPDALKAMAANPQTRNIVKATGLGPTITQIVRQRQDKGALASFNQDVQAHMQQTGLTQAEAEAAVARTKPEYMRVYGGTHSQGGQVGIKDLTAPPSMVAQQQGPRVSTILALLARGTIAPENAAAELAALGPAGEAAIQANPILAEARAAHTARGTTTGTATGQLTPIPPQASAAVMTPAGPMRAAPPVASIAEAAPGAPAQPPQPGRAGLRFGPPAPLAPRFVPEVGGANPQTGEPFPTAGEVGAQFKQEGKTDPLDKYVFEVSRGKYKSVADAQAANKVGIITKARELQTTASRKAVTPQGAHTQVVQIGENQWGVANKDTNQVTPMTLAPGPGQPPGQPGEPAKAPAKGFAADVERLIKKSGGQGGQPATTPPVAAAGPGRGAPGRPAAQAFSVAQPPAAGAADYAQRAIAEGRRLVKQGMSESEAIQALKKAGWNVDK